MTRRSLTLVGLLLTLFSFQTLAQSTSADSTTTTAGNPAPSVPHRGVVWTPPVAPGPGFRALNRMRANGITAVRLTALPASERVLTRADSLNLRLFIDLPVSYVSAGALRDSLRAAQPTLHQIQAQAARHRSVYAVGLARSTNTTTAPACPVLREWTRRLHDADPPLKTYYVTPFTAAHDQCADAVDMPLLDARDRDAVKRWDRWRESAPNVGLGALGTWTGANAASGLNVRHSPEAQARHLERALSSLLDPGSGSPTSIFVYRWQDRRSPPLSPRRYGLHVRPDSARPAAEVLRGLYRGTQTVFAFPVGQPSFDTPVGNILLAWGLLALLGGLYARIPFVRQTVSRYFLAHGFYRDAIRKARDINTGANVVLLGVAVTAIGMTGALTAEIAAPQPATGLVVEALPASLQSPVAVGLTYPPLTGIVTAGLALLLLVGWPLALALIEWSNTLTLRQSVMLVTWPCWPTLLCMLIALIAATHPFVSPGVLGLVLLIGGAGTILAVTIRTLRDYWRLSRPSPGQIAGAVLTSPLVLLLLGGFVMSVQYDLPLRLLWHLVTRT